MGVILTLQTAANRLFLGLIKEGVEMPSLGLDSNPTIAENARLLGTASPVLQNVAT
ncbi:hypothetical protein GCM10007052_17630 [Halioglobus japonicus]|nr:hypothetical protein GCM10007052_17630 [Halioglobus japonicus]